MDHLFAIGLNSGRPHAVLLCSAAARCSLQCCNGFAQESLPRCRGADSKAQQTLNFIGHLSDTSKARCFCALMYRDKYVLACPMSFGGGVATVSEIA